MKIKVNNIESQFPLGHITWIDIIPIQTNPASRLSWLQANLRNLVKLANLFTIDKLAII